MFDDEAAVDLGGDPDDLDVLIEGGIDNHPNDNEDDAGENQDNAEGNQPDPEGTPVQPKKRIVKRPQPKLNPERLRGPRGVATLEDVFKDFKFHGKGYEKHDLNRMMKQLEHWAHRLFPRFQFDDCLEKIEKLGHKKPVGTLVKRIRMGLETGDQPELRAEDEDDDSSAVNNLPNLGDGTESPLDAFDALLSQQLAEARARTPLPPPQLSQPPQVLSEEQRERMLRNRQLAEERRLARLKAQQVRITQGGNDHLSSYAESSQVINVVEDAGQQVVREGALNSDSLHQETSQNNPGLDKDVWGEETSVQSNLEQKENSADVGTCDKVAGNDNNTGTNNESSEVALQEATVVSYSTVSAEFGDENNDLQSSKQGNDDKPDVIGQSLELNVQNNVAHKEDLVTGNEPRKEVQPTVDNKKFSLPLEMTDKNWSEMDVGDSDHTDT